MSDEERIEAITDELHADAEKIAWTIVGVQTVAENVKLTETKRLLVEMGILAGMPAMMQALANRDMLNPDAFRATT